MPELPEVELYCRYFAEHGLHQRVAAVHVLDERILGVRNAALKKAVVGREFTQVRRHGKHLFADAGSSWLHLHFGMSGDLFYYDNDSAQPRFARVVFEFDNGSRLAYDDMRLFGVVGVTPGPDAFLAEHRLGPDPISSGFRLPVFRTIVHGRRGAVKSLLMTQEIIAGMGNLYVDETLYRASIHPRRAVDALSDAEVEAIYTGIRGVLKEAIAFKSRGGDYPVKWLTQHREEGDRCPRCGGTIQRTVVFGRTTYFCAKHQV
ncbi:MAG: DNA-formamidopyrimidine glycosylase [Acidobacteria bacterium]|nr:DNA-formamidopyrimidine glycosylase [Acidobacteriota bacterium]MBV9071840.1 DNA-formamidopyrimidine glycosylase [Acidobacteriota bacterium]MBV9188778.1 DNA-formamidopyrimidine glycosylase [Acidobacteriota bacterium]